MGVFPCAKCGEPWLSFDAGASHVCNALKVSHLELQIRDLKYEFAQQDDALKESNRLNDELKARLAEIEKIATAYFDGDQAPMGCVLEVVLREPQKRSVSSPNRCKVGLPYGQSGVPDFCNMEMPCPKHPARCQCGQRGCMECEGY